MHGLWNVQVKFRDTLACLYLVLVKCVSYKLSIFVRYVAIWFLVAIPVTVTDRVLNPLT